MNLPPEHVEVSPPSDQTPSSEQSTATGTEPPKDRWQIDDLKKKVENNLIVWLLGTLVTGFSAGFGAYPALLSITGRTTVAKTELDHKQDGNSNRSAPVTPDKRIIPPDIPIKLITDKPKWVDLLIGLFETDGEVEKRGFGASQSSEHFAVQAVEYQLPMATKSFTWTLTGRRFFTLKASAYRLTADNLIQPLDIDKVGDSEVINFSVPECNQGDRLVAVVRIKWTGDNLQVSDLESAFRSSAR